jgi:hypothetical protein
MGVVECVSELTAGAARNTTKILYIASAHTKPGSDPGTFRDVSTCTVENRCGRLGGELRREEILIFRTGMCMDRVGAVDDQSEGVFHLPFPPSSGTTGVA